MTHAPIKDRPAKLEISHFELGRLCYFGGVYDPLKYGGDTNETREKYIRGYWAERTDHNELKAIGY